MRIGNLPVTGCWPSSRQEVLIDKKAQPWRFSSERCQVFPFIGGEKAVEMWVGLDLSRVFSMPRATPESGSRPSLGCCPPAQHFPQSRLVFCLLKARHWVPSISVSFHSAQAVQPESYGEAGMQVLPTLCRCSCLLLLSSIVGGSHLVFLSKVADICPWSVIGLFWGRGLLGGWGRSWVDFIFQDYNDVLPALFYF